VEARNAIPPTAAPIGCSAKREAERAGELLGLTRSEQALVCQLPRGVALWRVGQSSFLVEHELCPEELALADTDAAMRANPQLAS
jgi:hypothetical protein